MLKEMPIRSRLLSSALASETSETPASCKFSDTRLKGNDCEQEFHCAVHGTSSGCECPRVIAASMQPRLCGSLLKRLLGRKLFHATRKRTALNLNLVNEGPDRDVTA